MQLVAPLAGGITAAPSGTATFYAFSLSDPYGSPAIAYDRDGTALGTSVTLDANGIAECYVKARTRVLVETAAGAEVSTFDVVADDACATVENANFTGTDPVTGSQVVGGVLVQRSAWELLTQSFGAPNGRVVVAGDTAEQYLKDALGGLRATNFPFFNVQDPIYGAIGDGVTDDGPAIQAAITAAAVNGGVVFFPGGNYRTVQALSCTSTKVSFLGCGANASIITNATAGNVALTINAGSATSASSFIKALGIAHASTGATWGLQIIATVGMHIEDVRIFGHRKGINAQSRVAIRDCRITTEAGGTDEPISLTSGAAGSVVSGGLFVATGVTAAASVINVDVHSVVIDGALITTPGGGSATYGVDVSAAGCRVINCGFNTTAAGGLDYAMNLSADVDFFEDMNYYISSTFAFYLHQAAFGYTTADIHSGSRMRRTHTYVAGASVALTHFKEATHFCEGNANHTVNLVSTDPPPHGSLLHVILYNSTGGNITDTYSVSFVAAAPGNLATLKRRARTFVYDGDIQQYVQIGASTDV